MKSLLHQAVLSLLFLAFFTSCKKSQPVDTFPRATQTIKYLTQLPWKETRFEYQYQNGDWIGVPLTAEVMAQTNVFRTDGTYTVYNSNGTVNTNGIYDLIGDYYQLALNKSITYDITILDNTTLQLSQTSQNPFIDPNTGAATPYYGLRLTFSH